MLLKKLTKEKKTLRKKKLNTPECVTKKKRSYDIIHTIYNNV